MYHDCTKCPRNNRDCPFVHRSLETKHAICHHLRLLPIMPFILYTPSEENNSKEIAMNARLSPTHKLILN